MDFEFQLQACMAQDGDVAPTAQSPAFGEVS